MTTIKQVLYRWLVKIYHKLSRGDFGTEKWKKSFSFFGDNSVIIYPSIISGHQGIKIGNNTTILNNSRIQNFYQDNNNPQIIIGNHCYIGYYFTVLNASQVLIGNDVLFASHVLISSENHGIDPESPIPYMDQPLSSNSVIIGDGCWIGEKVIVLPGVSIGKKSIIGGGSVVTRSIPDYCMAVGNPAKIIKHYNFESHQWESVK